MGQSDKMLMEQEAERLYREFGILSQNKERNGNNLRNGNHIGVRTVKLSNSTTPMAIFS